MDTVSFFFWGTWAGAGIAYEIYAVRTEKRSGALPLTRVLRDRLMRRFVVVKLGVLLFIAWLAAHFFTPLSW